MDKKGFTLIELLVAIVLISLLSGIGIFSYQSLFKTGEDRYYDSLESNVLLAGNDYFEDHRDELPTGSNYSEVSLASLIDDKYIEPITDTKGNECREGSVFAYRENSKFKYEVCLVNCGEYNSTGKYCANLTSREIEVEAKTKTTNKIYDVTRSYNSVEYSKNENIIVSLNMNNDYSITKYILINTKDNSEIECNTSGNNTCVVEINKSGTYKVESYEGNSEISSKYINVKIARNGSNFTLNTSDGQKKYLINKDECTSNNKAKKVTINIVKGNANEEYKTVEYKVNNGAYIELNSLSKTLSLGSGHYEIEVVVTNYNDNVSVETISIDVSYLIDIEYSDDHTTATHEVVKGQTYNYLSSLPTSKDGREIKWYKGETLINPSTGIVNDDCTYTIIGNTIVDYNITYNLNGGSVATANPTVYRESTTTFTLNNPTRAGYTFMGWTGSSDISTGLGGYTTTSPYVAGARDHTMGNEISVTPGTTYRVIITAKRTKGSINLQGGLWYTSYTEGTAWEGHTGEYKLSEILSDDYARYYKDVTVPAGKSKAKAYVQLEQTDGNYTTSWNIADIHITKSPTSVTITKGSTGNKTYTANWIANTYSITLNNQSAQTAGTTKVYYQYKVTKQVSGTKCYYYTDQALTTCLTNGYTITNPIRAGYTYGGYYTGTSGSGTNYVNTAGTFINNIYQKLPSEINSSYTNDITLYAKWTSTTYTLTLNANGGSVSPTTKTVTYGNTYTDLPTPTRTGHTFKGWYGSFNGTAAAVVNYGRAYMYTNKLSVHFSAYMSSWSSYTRAISCTEGGGWNLEPGSEKPSMACYDSGVGYKNATGDITFASLAAGWHDFDLIFNGTNAKIYVDGTLRGTSSNYSSGKIGYHGSNSIFVGGEAAGSPTTATSPFFNGYIGNVVIKNTDAITPSSTYNTITAPAQNQTLYARWDVNNYYLDLNGWLNGASSGNISGYGTCDVYINGSQVANDVTDYYKQHPYGSTYEIKDCKSLAGYTYNGVYSGSLKGSIGAGNVSVSVNFTTNALTFNNQSISKTFSTSAQTFSVTGASNGTGTYTYSEVSEKNSGGTATSYISISGTTVTIAANTPAGTYTYVIRAKDSKSNVTKDATYTITVGKAASSITCVNRNYTGSAQNMYSASSGCTPSTNKSVTNAGTYTVSCTGDANHNNSSCSATMNKVDVSLSCANKNYNGSSQTIATCSGGTLSNHTRTAAGSQTVTCTGDANHNTKTASCSINKAASSITCANRTYNGSAQNMYSASSGCTPSTNKTATNAGTYTVSCTGDANHNNSSCSATMNKAASSITCANRTYNGSAQNMYSASSGCTPSTNKTATNAGTYTVSCTGDANHNNSSCSATMNRAIPSLTITETSASFMAGTTKTYGVIPGVNGHFDYASTNTSVVGISMESDAATCKKANTQCVFKLTGVAAGNNVTINHVYTPDDLTNYTTASVTFTATVTPAVYYRWRSVCNCIGNGTNHQGTFWYYIYGNGSWTSESAANTNCVNNKLGTCRTKCSNTGGKYDEVEGCFTYTA